MSPDRPNPLFREPKDGLPHEPTDPNEDFKPSRVLSRLTADGVVEYRPGEVLVDLSKLGLASGASARAVNAALKKNFGDACETAKLDTQEVQSGFARVTLEGVDPLSFVDQLGADSPFSINTVFRVAGLTADPIKFAGSLTADPIKFAAALGLDPIKFANASTARPAAEPTHLQSPKAFAGAKKNSTTVAIVDTGTPKLDAKGRPTGVVETCDANNDGYVDIAAGHALFIHGIVERAEPTVTFWFEGVMHNDGDGDDFALGAALDRILAGNAGNADHLVVNLSLSGYYLGDVCPPVICDAIKRLQDANALVVAAAGNDGACRKKFPAAMPGVVSVAALAPCDTAEFSNRGGWVDACAPGQDLISEFLTCNGAFNPPAGSMVPDIDDFHGWAMWSGTSFSTPAVVGAIVQAMRIYKCTALQAKEIVLGRRGLFRIPDFGVVVNRVF